MRTQLYHGPARPPDLVESPLHVTRLTTDVTQLSDAVQMMLRIMVRAPLLLVGSLALGSEDQPLAYGDDPERNMAGVLERIGPFRWRLVIPWPQSTSKLDVFELTPVDNQPKG